MRFAGEILTIAVEYSIITVRFSNVTVTAHWHDLARYTTSTSHQAMYNYVTGYFWLSCFLSTCLPEIIPLAVFSDGRKDFALSIFNVSV